MGGEGRHSRSRIERPGSAARGGFSLLELVFVLLILAGVLALAMPSLRGFGEARQVRDTASNVLVLAKYARFRAVCEGREYRLCIDRAQYRYWLETTGEEGFERPLSSFGRVFFFPETMLVEWFESDAVERKGYIAFAPNGRSDAARLHLTGRLGTVIEVGCEAPGEPFRIQEVFDTGVRRG